MFERYQSPYVVNNDSVANGGGSGRGPLPFDHCFGPRARLSTGYGLTSALIGSNATKATPTSEFMRASHIEDEYFGDFIARWKIQQAPHGEVRTKLFRELNAYKDQPDSAQFGDFGGSWKLMTSGGNLGDSATDMRDLPCCRSRMRIWKIRCYL